MAQMPQVLILGIVGLAGDLQRHLVSFGVVDLFLSGLDVPLTPGSDDGHIGCKPLDGQLEPHLIVALAGRAVCDGIRTLGQSDLGQLLANNGPCKGGAQQVSLVLGIHLHGGDDHIVHHLIGQICHDQLGSAGLESLLFQPVQLIVLAYVAGHSNDLRIVVVFLQPGNDNGCIQTAGICKNDLLNVFFIHDFRLQMNKYSIYCGFILHPFPEIVNPK